MSQEDVGVDIEEHTHCANCYKANCKAKDAPPISCAVIKCDQDCGALYHACKSTEHRLTCRTRKVPCINHVNGCPVVLPRWQCGIHLETCPASVVYCTMEWNRWPVYSQERRSRVPFSQDNRHAQMGQLDVALALRDQRMLNQAMKAPKSTRRVLRNNLTRRFPAVPFHGPIFGEYEDRLISSGDTSKTLSDDDEAPWQRHKAPPGLQRSVLGELYKATKKATESLSAALDVATNGISSPLTEVAESEVTNTAVSENVDSIIHAKGGSPAATNSDLNLNICASGQVENAQTLSCEDNGFDFVTTEETAHNGCYHVNVCGAETEEVVEKEATNHDCGNDRDFSCASGVQDEAHEVPVKRYATPPPPPMMSSKDMKQPLSLDLNLESITRYQAKPKSMYTFLCAQEYRRDEYKWHFKNVHGEIHAGLNGWLDSRCPLAHYGCTFSLPRFHPVRPGFQIVYNDILESFGLKPDCAILKESEDHKLKSLDKTDKEGGDYDISLTDSPRTDSDIITQETNMETSVDYLTTLPFELLQYIAHRLDSFSLCNLALTSKKLREVCCSLLEERGVVVEQWEKVRSGEKFHWQVGFKRWFFSTAFTPVEQWCFADNAPHMSEHLSSCRFFKRVIKTKPFAFPSMSVPNKQTQDMINKIMANLELEEKLDNSSQGGSEF